MHAKAYTGRHGQTGRNYELTLGDGPEVRIATKEPLAPGEGLTAVVLFPPGHVEHASPVRDLWHWLQDNRRMVLLLCIVVL